MDADDVKSDGDTDGRINGLTNGFKLLTLWPVIKLWFIVELIDELVNLYGWYLNESDEFILLFKSKWFDVPFDGEFKLAAAINEW